MLWDTKLQCHTGHENRHVPASRPKTFHVLVVYCGYQLCSCHSWNHKIKLTIKHTLRVLVMDCGYYLCSCHSWNHKIKLAIKHTYRLHVLVMWPYWCDCTHKTSPTIPCLSCFTCIYCVLLFLLMRTFLTSMVTSSVLNLCSCHTWNHKIKLAIMGTYQLHVKVADSGYERLCTLDHGEWHCDWNSDTWSLMIMMNPSFLGWGWGRGVFLCVLKTDIK